MEQNHYPFPVKPLPYPFDALVPHLNAPVLFVHHDKHYKNYVNQLNAILKNQSGLQQKTLKELLTEEYDLPDDVRVPLLRNAGGVYNHELYFASMGPGNSKPQGKLEQQINAAYGSLEGFEKAITQAALSVFGSGYAWLLEDENQTLSISTTANQDVPNLNRFRPVLNIDMWEHAYYLQYQNQKDKYVENWLKVIDWEFLSTQHGLQNQSAGQTGVFDWS